VAFYLDTSAAVKLVVAEPETTALLSWATEHDGKVVSSDLTRTELLRATRRADPDRLVEARAVLDSLVLVSVTTAIFERAGLLRPGSLRSLDALHLAVALELGDDLDGVVAYDERLAAAARANGVAVLAPGAAPLP
jgi:predicted nucleic acid-binding protein